MSDDIEWGVYRFTEPSDTPFLDALLREADAIERGMVADAHRASNWPSASHDERNSDDDDADGDDPERVHAHHHSTTKETPTMTDIDLEEAAIRSVRALAADCRHAIHTAKLAEANLDEARALADRTQAKVKEARIKLANAVDELCNIEPAPHDHSMWFPRGAWDTPNGELICRIANKRTGKNPVDIRLVENKDAWCVTLDDYSQIEVTGIEVAEYQP